MSRRSNIANFNPRHSAPHLVMRLFTLLVAGLFAATTAAQPVADLSLQRVLAGAGTPYYYTRAQDVASTSLFPESTSATSGRLGVIVKTKGDALLGYAATPIGQNIYTLRVTDEELRAMAADTSLCRIAASPRHRLLTDRTRQATGTDRVLTGEGLDAPFTGRGVIIGVIDEGFEYRHAAFLDANAGSRVRYVWNRRIEGSQPTADIPDGGDGYNNTGGHATHTACIAAGRSAGGSNFYGMAPDAELIFIPSNLDNAELLEDAAFVSRVARAEGKPWILNLSFGSHDGPHDGQDLYSRTMDSLLLADGGFLVGAMGNEGGNKYHAAATLCSGEEPARFLLTPGGSEVMLEVWVQATDSLRHAVIRPFVLRDGSIDYDGIDFGTAFLEEVNPDNLKQHASLYMSRGVLYNSGGYLPVGIEVTATDAADIPVHAWTDEGFGIFYTPDARFAAGDDQYLVCEGGASVPSAIAVGAYTAGNTTERLNGSSVSFATRYPLEQICPFSNSGPYLGSGVKPTVAAPGAVVRAAVSKAAPDFSARGSALVEARTIDGEKYYYGYKSGTSMSAPAVSGILALWLEACPTLSRTQLEDILRTTSTTEDDALHWGYGRIDAYAGLKAALQFAAQSGIERTQQSDFPVALHRTADGWHILACRDTDGIRWRILDTAGRTLRQGTGTTLSQSNDILVPTTGLPQGIYLLHIVAGGKAKTKRFAVG